ncbi:beta-phosphoglucomutase [Ectobacillus antri]|jgi:beta-phosphoglucomutase|uniref:beta-phosphoglucomutase n=1 Tax=Ectobacillus antri TaxID=2486280 RepID=UPI000F5B4C64|nr:beta-phosphoglucomutase [Ectobacillus antri]
MTKQVQAFIFDLDGVITDSAEHHYLAWKQLGQELHIPFDREFNEQLKGVSRMDSLERILALGNRQHDFTAEEKEALATKKNEHYKELIKGITEADILPGITELLADIRKHGLKVGLASASKNAFVVIDRLGVGEHFHYIVDAAKVAKGKPDPEIFLKAADALGVPYENCIGVEDAEAGIEAIKAAGMFAVGVGTPESMAKADYVVSGTSELRYDEIIARFQQTK